MIRGKMQLESSGRVAKGCSYVSYFIKETPLFEEDSPPGISNIDAHGTVSSKI